MARLRQRGASPARDKKGSNKGSRTRKPRARSRSGSSGASSRQRGRSGRSKSPKPSPAEPRKDPTDDITEEELNTLDELYHAAMRGKEEAEAGDTAPAVLLPQHAKRVGAAGAALVLIAGVVHNVVAPLPYISRVLVLFTAGVHMVYMVMSLPPLRQPLSYHAFADQRKLACVPNFNDVASNFPFMVVGGAALALLLSDSSDAWGIAPLLQLRPPQFGVAGARVGWVVFFAGIGMTSVGSAYYHWRPTNPTLVWDRLPMTIAFMSLFSVILADYVHPAVGSASLWWLLAVGLASVLYWASEDDLRPYFCVQFVPMLLIPCIVALFAPTELDTAYLLSSLGAYGLAKLTEELDRPIFEATQGVISGHTIKHLCAALASFLMLHMICGAAVAA